jgi:hypothetical protein
MSPSTEQPRSETPSRSLARLGEVFVHYAVRVDSLFLKYADSRNQRKWGTSRLSPVSNACSQLPLDQN